MGHPNLRMYNKERIARISPSVSQISANLPLKIILTRIANIPKQKKDGKNKLDTRCDHCLVSPENVQLS